MLPIALGLLLAPVQDTVTIEGVVRDTHLEPVAGAEIVVTRSRHPGTELFRTLETDDEGRFHLDLPRDRVGTLMRQHLVVHALHPDYILGSNLLNPYMPPGGWELAILLQPLLEDSRLRVVGPKVFHIPMGSVDLTVKLEGRL